MLKHMIRKNNQQVRKSQQRAMAAIYQTFEQCEAIFALHTARELRPEEMVTADAGDYFAAEFDLFDNDR